MEFKCKYCNGTKYRQISVMVKQCEECGRQIASEGVVDDKLDFSEERNEEEVNLNEIKVGEGLWAQLKAMSDTINSQGTTNRRNYRYHYYVDPELWFIQ